MSLYVPLMVHSETLLSKGLQLYLGLLSPFLLLSVHYETLFYVAFGATLFAWVGLESSVLAGDSTHAGPSYVWTYTRVTFLYLIFWYLAFFGTGNIASVSSFDPSAVYCFVTMFNPFLMAALLLFKLLIPFMLVGYAFLVVCSIHAISTLTSIVLVVCLSELTSVTFLFLVRDFGSWKDIGMSISHFAISNATIVFQLTLYGLCCAVSRRVSPRCSSSSSKEASLLKIE